MMNWHILGAGSLGCLWAARLAAQQHHVQLIVRDAAAITAYQHTAGVGLSDAQHHSTQYYPVQVQLATDSQPIDYLLLACKAYDAQAAISHIAHRLSPSSVIVLLQNGLGSQQAIQTMLPHVRCLAASSTEGAYLLAPFHSVLAGQGHTQLGDLQPTTQPAPQNLLTALNAAGIHCTWSTQITHHLWRKLAINCAINPMTVIYNCLNGELVHHSERINTVCQELEQLLQHAGQPAAAHDLTAQIWQVIEKTASNSSSMRQDVQQRRRTEISYITGFACAQSIALECHTPALHQLHAQLHDTLSAHGLSTA